MFVECHVQVLPFQKARSAAGQTCCTAALETCITSLGVVAGLHCHVRLCHARIRTAGAGPGNLARRQPCRKLARHRFALHDVTPTEVCGGSVVKPSVPGALSAANESISDAPSREPILPRIGCRIAELARAGGDNK
jgi:hypothetical protein